MSAYAGLSGLSAISTASGDDDHKQQHSKRGGLWLERDLVSVKCSVLTCGELSLDTQNSFTQPCTQASQWQDPAATLRVASAGSRHSHSGVLTLV